MSISYSLKSVKNKVLQLRSIYMSSILPSKSSARQSTPISVPERRKCYVSYSYNICNRFGVFKIPIFAELEDS